MYIGAPFGWGYGPYYYPSPYYYSPPYYGGPVVTQPGPPIYLEQELAIGPAPAPVAPEASASGAGYWYYCREPKGYYPSVKDCPTPWVQVAPRPPG